MPGACLVVAYFCFDLELDTYSVFITYLDRLYKRKQQDTNTDTSSQQFDKPGGPEQTEESNVTQDTSGINDTSNDGNEIKSIPRILEVCL